MRTLPLRVVRPLLVVVSLWLVAACGAPRSAGPALSAQTPIAAPAPQGGGPTPTKPTPRTKTKPGKDGRPSGAERFEKIARTVEPGTTLGIEVYDRTEGQVVVRYHGARPFRSASLVKLMIAIDVLERGADAGDRQRLARMLALSDDDLASQFWVDGGGEDIVTRVARELSLGAVRVPEDPTQWGQVVLTADSVVAIYRHIVGMPAADQNLVVEAMADAPRIAKDGSDQYFGIPDGFPGPWAVKQGWGNNESADVLHSTGLVGPRYRFVVVLLTEHPLGTSWGSSRRAATEVVRSLAPLLRARALR